LTITKNEKAGTNSQTSVVLTQMSYDSLMRVVRIEKKVSNTKVNSGSMPGSWTTETQNEYDALGQLKKKKLGVAPLDSLVYDYNIRGWMLGMNRSYVKDTTSTTNWFGFDLGYDKTSFSVNGANQSYTAAQYNGNIAGMLWRSTGDDMLRKYDFTYDAVNRLTGADFNQLNSNSFSKAAKIDFSVSGLTYDANGNILTMNQKGWKLGGSVTIDSLLYTYNTSSNKLLNVLDRKNDTATKLGDFRSSTAYMNSLSNNKTISATDYTYDANGNLSIDKNKDITLIHYNYLNLPDSIIVTNKGHITYTYDAAGNKLKKVTTEGSKVTTTLYLFGNFVNDTLQFLPTEEGRIRFNVANSSLQYDYFIKDHLGNIRMVLTEQKDTSFYPDASLETATIANERLYYSGVDTGRVNKSTVSGYPTDTYTNPNDYIQKLNGNGPRVGMGIVLKVMAGDKFNLRVNSWWYSNNSPGTPVSPLNDLLTALNSGVAGASSGHYTTTDLSSASALNPGATDFLNSHTGYNSSVPKAFVNWVLFDEQFKYVAASSGFEQVGSSNTFTTHTRTNVAINKSGYLYIYVSNETPNIDVFFDNLQVTHIRGNLVSEDHYYPFGERMFNLCDEALNFGNGESQKKKYNGIDWQNDLGLNEYDAQLRDLDGQTGRWWQIDPKPSDWESPYAAMSNNPILKMDILGDSDIAPRVRAIGVSDRSNEKKPFISLTIALTEGTYGVKGKIFNVGFESVSSVDEKDIVALRDNKPVVGGHEDGNPDIVTVRNGYEGSIAGIGGSDIKETKETASGTVIESKKTSTISSPLLSATKEVDSKGNVTESASTSVFSFKAGLYYGAEVQLEVNWGNIFGAGVVNVPSTHIDNTYVRKPTPIKPLKQ
jgi:RHS repeat-associated protein